MDIKKIGSEFTRTLGRLEAEIYPPAFCLGWQDFKEDLEEAEANGGNYSFGLFHQEKLVGYIVAYRQGDGVFISDLAFLPKQRAGRNVAALLKVFFQAVAAARLPIYAECRKDSFRLCTEHPEFFRTFGFVLSKQEPTALYGGENGWAVRLDKV